MNACVWLSRKRATVFAQPNNVDCIPDDGQYDLVSGQYTHRQKVKISRTMGR